MKKLFILISLFCLLRIGFSQTNDFETWSAISISKNLNDRFRIAGEAELRLHENSTKINKAYTEIGCKYDYTENIDISIFYRFEEKRSIYNQYSSGHRFLINLLLYKEYSSFEISLRNRIQSKYVNAIENDWDIYANNYYRAKFGFDYKIRKSPVKPSFSTEFFYRISRKNQNMFNQYRITLGINYKFSKKASIDFYIRTQSEFNVANPANSQIIGFCYNYKL
ncbi:MAG: DUF2490 domain-containing protein [Bacteroidota bacterium]